MGIFKQRKGARNEGWAHPSMESLEDRTLFSSSAVATIAAATPKKLIAGETGYDTVTIHNTTTSSVTENVTITLEPSTDGSTSAGSYSSPSVTESVTLKPHAKEAITVPFSTENTQAAGKYYTLASVQVGSQTVNLTAPGKYTLTAAPATTTTPSLVGHFTGLIHQTTSSGGYTNVKDLTFDWTTTSQSSTSLTGTFSVGAQSYTGTMTGSEYANGTFAYSLYSSDITYAITGKVLDNGTELKGKFRGTLVNNIFKKLTGPFKITTSA